MPAVLSWSLAYCFGPSKKMKKVEDHYAQQVALHPELQKQFAQQKKTGLLENSYAGILGKSIEPVIQPLGYDWKIGIALITSFAAREVFVGTMATLYSVGDEDKGETLMLRDKMRQAKKPDGSPVYTLAAALSLMIFYVFAMQCMSTLAIVRRETGTWKWPLIQLVYMTGLAYILSLFTYQIFS